MNTLASRTSRLTRTRNPLNGHFQRAHSTPTAPSPPPQNPPAPSPPAPSPPAPSPPRLPLRVQSLTSESDSDTSFTMSFSTTTPTSSGMATIKFHDAGKSAPILNDGIITPSVLQLWKKKAEIFFDVRKIEDDDRVKNVLSSFSTQTLVNWINENEVTLRALPWADFITQLKRTALTPGWDNAVFRSMVNVKQPRNETFCVWMNGIRGANFSLSDTRFHKDAVALRAHLESLISDDLADFISSLSKNERDRVEAIEDFEEWLRELMEIDDNMSKSRKRHEELIDRAVKRQRTSYNSYRPATTSTSSYRPSNDVASSSAVSSINPSAKISNYSKPSGSTAPKFSSLLRTKVTIPPGYRFPPKLTETERELLRKYLGCRVCRQLFADHPLPCNVLPPDASTYIPITQELVDQILASRGSTVAALENGNSSVAPSDEFTLSSSIGAVIPSASTPFTLGNGSFSTDEVCPLSVRHLLWDAKVLDNLNSFSTVSCLIDTGAHINCVRSDIVARLKMTPKLLPKPLPVTLAFDGSSVAKPIFLSSFIEFSLTTFNSSWTSRVCKAVIVPNLCADFILGLPFLTFNKIVVDSEKRIVSHKPSGLNLIDNNSTLQRVSVRKFTPLSKRRRAIAQIHRSVISELKIVCQKRRKLYEEVPETPVHSFIASIRSRVESLAYQETLKQHDTNARTLFADIFKPVPHVNRLPFTDSVMRIELKDDKRFVHKRNYTIPRHYEKAMDEILDLRLSQGFIRPSNSQFVSPSFIVPKSDPSALPRWVCDYRVLNSNTLPDNYPLPKISEILSNCGRGKIWSKIDLTDSYFQTRVHPNDIHKTAVSTPRGLFEWTVMPMGFRNAPAIQQRRLENALREFIGKICHVYLDDIIIWSNSLDEHIRHVNVILTALRRAGVYINPKKTILYSTDVEFLGHRISLSGIEACDRKADKILNWPVPTSATETRQFLGLVRYLQKFLPNLAEHCRILEQLTHKKFDREFPPWTQASQNAFDAIKHLVVSRDCLTVIDPSLMPKSKIFVTTDASDVASGAVLSFGESWESARPVAYDSCSFKDSELNYPVHEKELLAIIRALKKWKYELLGTEFFVYTDHKTLLNFHTQRDLSRRQARWMEFLSIYDCKFIYVKGDANCVADALSRLPGLPCQSTSDAESSASHPYNVVAPVYPILSLSEVDSPLTAISALTIKLPVLKSKSILSIDPSLVDNIRNSYSKDPWCQKLLSASRGMQQLLVKNGLWYLDNRLIVPNGCGIREEIFRMAHDALGHFGFSKTYDLIRSSYFWPNMRTDLEDGYIPSCIECQRNKSSTSKPTGPLHPLPVPDDRCQSIAMDFIGPLPDDKGFNCILTITDRLNSEFRLIPTRTDITAKELALVFFDKWYCENGLPLDLVTDRDKLFMSRFWHYLTLLTGIKHKASTSYHPQSDGSSERTNKTLVQSLRFHVERNQKGWVSALPRIRFNYMCTVNKSTGYSPFMLRFGKDPIVLPPLDPAREPITQDEIDARAVISHIYNAVKDAKDNLLVAKITQAFESNKNRDSNKTFPYKIGDSVLLSTLHRRSEYLSGNGKRVAKFLPRFDGPYPVIDTHPEASTVTLDLPNQPNVFPTFHIHLIKPFIPNDDNKFPHRAVRVTDTSEFFVETIIDHKPWGRGNRYLVKFQGYPDSFNRWLSGKDLENDSSLDVYLKSLPPCS